MGNHHNIRVRAGPVAPPARPRPGPSPPESVPWCAHPHKFLNHPHLWLKESEHFGILCRHLIVSPSLHPGGMSACSRWLSGAIPPEPNAPNPPAPRQGCQPNHYPHSLFQARARWYKTAKPSKKPRNITFITVKHPVTQPSRLQVPDTVSVPPPRARTTSRLLPSKRWLVTLKHQKPLK